MSDVCCHGDANPLRVCPAQTSDPQGAVVAEAPPPHEDPGQVQDELRRVRLRAAGAPDSRLAQGGHHLSPAPPGCHAYF